AFFPRVSLTTTYVSASSELEGLFDAGSHAWKFSPSISLPIFDAGRNRANLDLAEVRRDLAVADYEKTIQTALREVADALAAREELAGRRVGRRQSRLDVLAQHQPADLRCRPQPRQSRSGRGAARPRRGRLRKDHPDRFPRSGRCACCAPVAAAAGAEPAADA